MRCTASRCRLKLSAFVVMLLGLFAAWASYIRAPRFPAQVTEQVPVLYRFLLHKWYVDELYHAVFVRPAFAIGRVLWHRGDEQTIDRFGPNGSARLVQLGSRGRCPVADRLSLYLRVRHADRADGCGDLGDLAVTSFGFPILSVMLAIPAIAAVACLFLSPVAARWLALGATLADLALGVTYCGRATTSAARSGSSSSTRRSLRRSAGHWAIDGFALMLIMLSVFLMPICIGASWQAIQSRVPEYMAAFLLTEVLMIGTFAAQDLFLFYIFFEAGLIPMYLIIGIWGGANRNLRQLQVLPIYAARLDPDADRDAVHEHRGGHDVDPGADGARLPGAGADLAVACVLRLRSRSRCRCGRSTPGFPTRTSRRRPRDR